MQEEYKGVSGSLELFRVVDGKWELIHEQHNMVTYGGGDLMAKAVAGLATVTGMYLGFRNGADTPFAAAKTNDAAYYATVSANRSICRVSTMAAPVFTASSADYANNKVAFLAVTDGTSLSETVTVTDGVSEFYHCALVSLGATQADDVIFSCAAMGTALTKIAGAQIGIRWTLTFTAP